MDKLKLPDDFDPTKFALLVGSFFLTGFIIGYAIVANRVKKNPYYIRKYPPKRLNLMILDS